MTKGASFVDFGEFGMQALERGWVTAQQIEACRVTISRHFSRKERFGFGFFLISRYQKSPQKLVWGLEKAL